MACIDPARTIQWIGAVNNKNLKRSIKRLNELLEEKKKAKIFLMIQTNGGEMSAGFAFYDYVRSVAKTKITTIALGDVASMGVILFLTGAHRIMTPSSQLYLHPARLFAGELIEEARGSLLAAELMVERYKEIVSRATNRKITKKETGKLMQEVTVFTADDAIKRGLAHELWTAPTA